MRTIKFRGKDIETGKWVDGDLIQRMGYMPSIMFPYKSNGKIHYGECAVNRETVGQLTGLIDKNGNEIYEGDILANENQPNKFIVEWNRHLAQFQGTWNNMHITAADIYSMVLLDYKVVGNIHDNPELLKGGNNDNA